MENTFDNNEKTPRLKWKMRSVKMKNPFTKIGKILSVNLKIALGKIDNPLGKLENPLSRIGKSAR
jgi:hypothetical protein